MLMKETEDILKASKGNGWVVEPEAKRLLSLAGVVVPKFGWAKDVEEAVHFVKSIDYPVVAKIVSSQIIHKSDVGGVVTNIDREEKLRETFSKFSHFDGFAGILVEEMVDGLELIVGSKNDYQFGPVILCRRLLSFSVGASFDKDSIGVLRAAWRIRSCFRGLA